MDDVISPKMRIKIEDIIGGTLVEMSIKAQVQLLYLSKEYEHDSKAFIFEEKSSKMVKREIETRKNSQTKANIMIILACMVQVKTQVNVS